MSVVGQVDVEFKPIEYQKGRARYDWVTGEWVVTVWSPPMHGSMIKRYRSAILRAFNGFKT